MDRPRRRAVLATLGSIVVAGCLDSSSGDDSTPDDASETPGSTGGSGSEDASEPTPTSEPTASETPDEDESSTATEDASNTPTRTPEATPPPADSDDELFPDYGMTNVAVRTPGSELLGWVRAALADTGQKRYTGLSDTTDLPPQYGMLFLFDDVGDRRFVMREMDFGIDIVYADADGQITGIHHASAPGPDEDGNEQEYPGRGKYVLEVNYDWTTDHGVEVGDVLSNLPEE